MRFLPQSWCTWVADNCQDQTDFTFFIPLIHPWVGVFFPVDRNPFGGVTEIQKNNFFDRHVATGIVHPNNIASTALHTDIVVTPRLPWAVVLWAINHILSATLLRNPLRLRHLGLYALFLVLARSCTPFEIH